MKSAKQQKEKVMKPSTKRKAAATELENSARYSRGQHTKAKRIDENLIAAKDVSFMKYDVSQEQGCYSSEKVASLGTAGKVPSDGHRHQTVASTSAKIKLQLFPLDETIRIGLEKDGFNPHLELTLSAQKRISSVIKHFNSKWGSSSVALGEPMLFPFNIELEKLTAHRSWTLNDTSTRAADVHVDIGSPPIFRLRYGWFSAQQEIISKPSATSSLARIESGVSEKGCHMMLEASTPTKVISEDFKAVDVELGASIPSKVISEDLKVVNVEQPTRGAVEQMTAVEPLNTEAEGLENGVSHTTIWSDSLSNISIGALLSEDSLLGKFSMFDGRSNDGRSGFQPAQLPADSFDAFIANQLKIAPEPNNCGPSQLAPDTFDASIANYLRNAQEPRTLSVPSSILDAEETCHSFAFKKSNSSENELLGDGRSFFASFSGQDVKPKTHNSPIATEVSNKQHGPSGNNADQEPEPEPKISSKGLLNEESSLGFSNIKWTDSQSQGPFDHCLSTQQHIIKGDSISLSEFVR